MFDVLLAALAGIGASCAVPPNLAPAAVVPQETRRILPIRKYVLAWYWWPENCQRYPGVGCDAGFGFKVHGLWPDGAGRSYPQFCRAPTAISRATLRANWCMTPSAGLLQHEWAKHGTCGWPSADAYFADARRIAARIDLPDLSDLPNGATAGDVRRAIRARNPQLPAGSIFVGTQRKQWLTEVRICLDLRYRAVTCERGATGAPDRVPVRVRRT